MRDAFCSREAPLIKFWLAILALDFPSRMECPIHHPTFNYTQQIQRRFFDWQKSRNPEIMTP